MTIEDRIRETLHAAGDGIPVGDRGLAPVERGWRGRRWRPAVIFVVAFVAVALLGVGLLVLAPADRPAISAPRPLRVDDTGSLAWRRQPLGPGWLAGLAQGPDGWLVMATDLSGAWKQPEILRTDGATWSTVEAAGLPKAVSVGVTGSPDGYLAYGLYAGPGYTVTTKDHPSNFPEPAVWESADGTAWTLIPLPLPSPDQALSSNVSYGVDSVALADGVGVAVGSEVDENAPPDSGGGSTARSSRTVVWRTTGAEGWELADDAPFQARLRIVVAAGPAGIAAAVPTAGSTDIWVTSDTTTWRQVSTLDGAVVALVGNADGYLAHTTAGGVWFSPDATSWTAVGSITGMGAVGAGPGGFVYADGTPQPATAETPTAPGLGGPLPLFSVSAFWSPDGRTWRQIAATGDLPALNDITAVGTDGTAAIIGGDALDQSGQPQHFAYIGTTP